jgi:hypothetical protein
MPLGRYFLFTASLLLALLFLADRYMPQPAAEAMRADVDRTVIRIHSGHKWPDAVVIDTNLPTITPPQVTVAEVRTNTPARDAFAQLPQVRPAARPASSLTELRPTSARRHHVKVARAAVRHVASYQANDFRGVAPTGWWLGN